MAQGIIRGLTLWRPWQNCFLLEERPDRPGPKRVENRVWYPKFACQPMRDGIALARSDKPLFLALHAGLAIDRESLAELREVEGFDELTMGEPGFIVGVCRLARVLDVATLGFDHPEVAKHTPWASGPYAWEVDDVVALPEPVACKGAQGLWTIPEDVVSQLREQRRRVKEVARG